MSPLDAITAGTLHSARLLGLDTSLGTVETGKTADLVVCDGDPVTDIDVIGDPSSVVLVVQDGRIAKDNLRAAQ
jgi:imidazolonepropionase-like amidohydrolase